MQIFSVDTSFGCFSVLRYVVVFYHVNKNRNEHFGVRILCVQVQMLGAVTLASCWHKRGCAVSVLPAGVEWHSVLVEC